LNSWNLLRPTVLRRYIFLEVAVPFFVALFVFTGLLFLVRILRLIELVVNNSVGISDVLLLFAYVLPRFFEIALPMSLLIAVIFAFGRLSSDSELVVMRSTGITLRKIAEPVGLFALLCFFVTAIFAIWITPWANYQFGLGLFQIAKTQASRGLIAGVFNDIGPFTIYAETIEGQGSKLEHVIISDERNAQESTYFARSGQILSDDTRRTITLRLFNGSIHRGDGGQYNLTSFDVNNINLNESELINSDLAQDIKKPHEMQPGELTTAIHQLGLRPGLEKKELRQLRSYQVEYQRRYVIPIACFCVAFIGMALGIQPSRGGAAWGPVFNISAGVLVIVAYYVSLALVTALSQDGLAPAWLLMWIPNLVLGFIAYRLFRLVESERWLAVSQAVGNLSQRISAKLGIKGLEVE